MNTPNRRRFLKVLGGAAAAAMSSGPLFRALADTSTPNGEFFIFIHASGGWDVTLWSDPRNERKGIVEPASTDNTTTAGVKRWVDAPLDETSKSFQLVKPAGSNITFGPGIGDLADHYDRLCIVNGIAMNTVSHPDGTTFSATGRHLAGGRAAASSIDTMLANELGTDLLFPLISVRFPSSFVGSSLDSRAAPLQIGGVATVAKSLDRSSAYDTTEDRDAVTSLLSEEALDIAKRSHLPESMEGLAAQYGALQKMLSGNAKSVFNGAALTASHPEFDYKMKFQGSNAINAAFAIEAMKNNLVRCASFVLGGVDTHNTNYQNHALMLQDIFDIIAVLIKGLDAAPHPTITGDKLSDHTHILVISDFCRTPQVNLAGGRDHYPNNSALIISPKFKSNFVYSASDPEQLLPQNAKTFTDGDRPIGPPDVLATFLGAHDVNPRKYMRDGEVVPELLRS